MSKYRVKSTSSRVIFEEMRQATAQKGMDERIQTPEGGGTEETFPYKIPKGKGLKFVWKANKEGGQTLGNRQVIVPVTKQIFKNDVLPRTQEMYYQGRTIDEKYKDFLRKDPNTYASYVDTGKGWKLTKIDRFDKIALDIAKKEEKGWVRSVDTFESSEAAEFRKISDSEIPKVCCPALKNSP